MVWRKGQTGFSLMELMVVIGLVAIVSLTYPALQYRSPIEKVNKAAWTLTYDLNWARSQAVAEHNPYIVSFDTANDSYRIYDDNGGDGIDPGELVRTRELSEAGFGVVFGYGNIAGVDGQAIEQDVTMGDTAAPVRQVFQSSGNPKYSGVVYLIHQPDPVHQNLNSQAAVASFLSGKIKIYSYSPTGGGWQ